ncbi:MAG: transglycosylase SLT domain-containing protein [Candidatus Thiodiazotropha weberae]|uniref:Murein transglycosylase n=1 Tax=Candidatus Thiodiazotropha endoloripes TaxID=1818881 RepID=A0A1E2UM24_9GAMM|nr:transglycosylase SLT domain-containing protein [Candidatus Thiodiazotropha endoloripes]MCG7897047.1 transglycosylase SLT domain-containing protein [Candidatus Thiodiazotropha weberae]MCG7987118.1 transglycosylase SLT domain-containing protein [Candidatus Thiodiazotropha lotti]MCG7904493.1 transglycosylase SLT domain-containing protein [Candidatus Thiodiazotropha weberae]MCG8010907.1 transglycosylase SLT domain-containing protein [Candidatus Thiodiazotropha lotti]MCG8019010.1 transglycosylas
MLRCCLLLLLLPGLLHAGPFKHVKHDHWSDRYDNYFRKYTKHYFGPHIDWHWFKAQGIAESGLQPKALSSAGAKGIMQILPATYQEIKEDNPHFTHIEEPRWNIAAGIYYDRMLYRKWKKGLPTEERLAFALGSYNAGYGNVLRAYRKAIKAHGEVKNWSQVETYAPGETRHYVRRIKALMVTK